jgi:hypothetical protein
VRVFHGPEHETFGLILSLGDLGIVPEDQPGNFWAQVRNQSQVERDA